MKKFLLLASLFIVAMNSCKKEEDPIVSKPEEAAVEVKPITITVADVKITDKTIRFYSVDILVVNPNIMNKNGKPISAGTRSEIHGLPAIYSIEDPENFQGVVTVRFVCYGINGNDEGREYDLPDMRVDLTKQSTFNLVLDKEWR